ncbi:MAG TPA: hypothetical protein VF474_14435 [Phenylobacterium sp.]
MAITEGAMALPLARLGRFLWGAFLGLIALLVLGLLVVLGAWLASSLVDAATGDGPKTVRALTVSGQEVARVDASDVGISNGSLDVRMTCRGACDDIKIEPGVDDARVRLLNRAGRCMACGGDTRWKLMPDRSAALAVGRVDNGGYR